MGTPRATRATPRAGHWRPRHRRRHRRQQALAAAPTLLPDPDTVKIVADLAARAYADERDRFKAVDTRIGLLLSATSAVTALVVTILIKPPDAIAHVPAHPRGVAGVLVWVYTHASAIYYCSIALALASLIIAILYFVRAERQDEYPLLDLDYWVDKATLARPSVDVQAELASAYQDAITGYAEVTSTKLERLRRGSMGLVGGVIILVLVALFTIVVAGVVQ